MLELLRGTHTPTLFALPEEPSPFQLPLCFLFPLALCTEFLLSEMLSTAASISSAAPKACPDSTLAPIG